MREPIEYIDVSMHELVFLRKEITDTHGVVLDTLEARYAKDVLPEEVMRNFDKYIGDGGATVQMGGETVLSQDFGCKAGIYYSVRLRCDNSAKAVDAMKPILVEHVVETLNTEFQKVMAIRDSFMGIGPPVEDEEKKKLRPKALPPIVRR